MHIVTKIFVVLVALLAVATVPFVIVQGANEAAFRTRYEAEKSGAESARSDLSASRATHARVEAELQAEIAAAKAESAQLGAEIEQKVADLAEATQELSRVKAQKTQMESSLAVLAESDRARGALIESLTKELTGLRDRAVDAERQLVEIRKQFEIVSSDFDAAQNAQMALQEEVARLREESVKAAQAVAAIGTPSAAGSAGETQGVQPHLDVVARITAVRRVGGTTYVEIDQGSRAGVAAGWTMAIADGNTYIGDLRIVRVDANAAVGVLEGGSEDRGAVAEGQRVISRLGS